MITLYIFFLLGGPQVITHNTVCGRMPATRTNRARNYHFECENGPINGRYVTLQKPGAGNELIHMNEIYLDHMQAVPPESLMKSTSKLPYMKLSFQKIVYCF